MLKGKKILLGITGSIAAYKSVFLVRLLVKAGAEVKVILTPSATDFVTPLTLSTLSKNPVLSEISEEDSWANHVMLGRWADLMLIAPLSCNTLAKMVHGLCDNLLMAVYLSATCPVVVAPAMDEDMWLHPTTKFNLDQFLKLGNRVIPVESGELASGLVGEGRMSEPEQILQYLRDHFFLPGKLNDKRILITAGPTYEPLDPVRFIGNHSSGKMGIALANTFVKHGAGVTLVLGPSVVSQIDQNIHVIHVKTAAEMYDACIEEFKSSDIAVMAAAVSDYSPVRISEEKIKKTGERFMLELEKTKDILSAIGKSKKNGQVVVGFALETQHEKEYALGKLKDKNADMIILNSLNDSGAGFGSDTNKITIFDKNGMELGFDLKSKQEVADDIVETIIRTYYA